MAPPTGRACVIAGSPAAEPAPGCSIVPRGAAGESGCAEVRGKAGRGLVTLASGRGGRARGCRVGRFGGAAAGGAGGATGCGAGWGGAGAGVSVGGDGCGTGSGGEAASGVSGGGSHCAGGIGSSGGAGAAAGGTCVADGAAGAVNTTGTGTGSISRLSWIGALCTARREARRPKCSAKETSEAIPIGRRGRLPHAHEARSTTCRDPLIRGSPSARGAVSRPIIFSTTIADGEDIGRNLPPNSRCVSPCHSFPCFSTTMRWAK